VRHWIKSRSACWQRASFALLLASGLVVLFVLPVGSVVWATPQQSALRQTIPTLTPTPIPSWVWVGRPGGNPVDYSPSGMPDFDQKQMNWYLVFSEVPSVPRGGRHLSRAPTVSQPSREAGHEEVLRDGETVWTHCGPVAVADCLWWLDSQSEPGSTAPPQVGDGHDLIASFGSWDDHDAQNVGPLVSDLAARLDTDGAIPGTDVTTFAGALKEYLTDKGLKDAYSGGITASPSFTQLVAWVRRGDAVVLLLGFWEDQGDRWVYLGGHYVAVAGVEPANRFVAVSDPVRDAWEAGEAVLGRSPVPHAHHPEDAEVHNDARYVSHDAYRVVTTEGPGGTRALESYVLSYTDVEGFFGQNMVAAFAPYQGFYGGAAITTKISHAMVISPKRTSFTVCLPAILKGMQWSQ
jgi:hypothetical protein